MLVWVPYADLVPQLAEGVIAEVYDGACDLPAGIDQVEFYAVPYTFDLCPLRVMAGMTRLRAVQLLTAGYEHVLPFLPDGVRLYRGGGIHDASTAELAVTLMLAALRRIPTFVLAKERQEWAHGTYDALADKRVVIVGYGGVGQAVERRLAAFEVAIDRVARTARDGVNALVDLPGLLPDADVVVLTVPLNGATRGLVDREFLARMRDGGLLVNVARGGVVDTDALVAELATGRLRAALDVTDPEPLPPGHPLWMVPNLVLSPHVGGNTTAFLPRAHRLIVAQVGRYLAGEPLAYEVCR